MTPLQKLSRKWDEKKAELNQLTSKLTDAKGALDAEEVKAVVEDRPISEKLRRKFAEASDKHAEAKSQFAILDRAIAEIRQVEDQERSRRDAETIEAFRKKAAQHVKRIRAAAFETRNAVQDFAALAEAENISTGWLDLLFPVANPGQSLGEMQVRFRQAEMIHAASGWIADDVMHSKLGPQFPEVTR